MYRNMCYAKIHRATVTEANLNYQGSLTIDQTLMAAADIKTYEKIQVVNIMNGARFETYAIEGAANSGVICANGAAARLVAPGDLVIILSYAHLSENELLSFSPKFVFVDQQNKVLKLHSSIDRDNTLA